MQVHQFQHENGVKAGCCNWEVSEFYWLASSREAARREIEQETVEDREPHGLCAHCMTDFLAERGHEIREVTA